MPVDGVSLIAASPYDPRLRIGQPHFQLGPDDFAGTGHRSEARQLHPDPPKVESNQGWPRLITCNTLHLTWPKPIQFHGRSRLCRDLKSRGWTKPLHG